MRVCFFSFLTAIFLFSTSPVPAEEHVYRFGVVPQFEPRKLADIWIPIIQELEQRTGLRFIMVGSPKIPDFEASFMAGEFDFAYMNPYHAMLAGEEQGYVPLVHDSGRKLSGVLVVHKDSPIQDVTELEGQKVAFPAPNALGASLLMRADLETIYGVKVRPIYVQTHSSVYLNVILNKAVAGGGVMSTLKSQSQEIQDKLRILYTTREMAPHPLTAHPRVPKEHQEAVRQALLDMAATDEGQALLNRIPMKSAASVSLEDYMVLKEWGLDDFYVH